MKGRVGANADRQRNQIRRALGWEVVHVFKDEGRSGYTGEFRRGFEDMLNYLGNGHADVC